MKDGFAGLPALFSLLAMILGGFHALMLRSGLPAYLGKAYGEPIEILYSVVSTLVVGGFAVLFFQKYELMGAGAEPAGTSLRDEFDALRANLTAHRDSEDAYATRLKKFLGWLDGFFQDKGEPTPRQSGES